MSRLALKSESDFESSSRLSSWWIYALIGVVGGSLAGMFGVGGGVVMVPALVIFAKLNQREASATSLAGIVPTALIGATTYALQGNVDWLAAVVLAVGAIFGAQIGTYVMHRVSQTALVWGFVAFQALVIVSLLLTTPVRGATVDWNLGLVLLLALVGLATGIMMGLLGVGGGVILVPALMILFGSGDLIAKGTSLVVMIPGALSGTISNGRKGLVHLRGALYLGIGAAVTTPFGALLAGKFDPRIGNILFAAFLILMVSRMVVTQLQKSRPSDS